MNAKTSDFSGEGPAFRAPPPPPPSPLRLKGLVSSFTYWRSAPYSFQSNGVAVDCVTMSTASGPVKTRAKRRAWYGM